MWQAGFRGSNKNPVGPAISCTIPKLIYLLTSYQREVTKASPVAVSLSVVLKLPSLSFYLYLHRISNESIVLCTREHVVATKILVLAVQMKITAAVRKQLWEAQNETTAGPSGNGQKSTGSGREQEGKFSPMQGSSASCHAAFLLVG